MISLATPIEEIGKINRKIIPALKHLGIKTLRDLLFHFPIRYDDFSNEKKISDIEVGETVTIQGKIESIENRRTFRKRMVLTEAIIDDGTDTIKAIWFNQPFLTRNLKEGSQVTLSGRVAKGSKGIYLQNPSHERIFNDQFSISKERKNIHTGGLVAIYPETYGITSKWLRYLISTFIPHRNSVSDPFEQDFLKRNNLLAISQALSQIHFPKDKKEVQVAERRFSFEDLFFIQLYSLEERLLLKKEQSVAVPLKIDLIKKFVASLPFILTDAQRISLWEIANDIAKSHPMNRILEGDVGSGKTVVAAASALLTVDAGFRVLFMAPTEILARQHFATLQKLLVPFEISVGLITASEKTKKDGQIVVGTHALIAKGVTFENLGLVVVDEQHRFGVNQRMALVRGSTRIQTPQINADKDESPRESAILTPHFLSMSATPIPRTLALTIYSDLDLSLLDEMPKSRKQIITEIVLPNERARTYQFIREEVKKGRQVFVICPRIEIPSEESTKMSQAKRAYQQKLLLLDTKNVKEEYKKLSEVVFPDLKVGMLHGKMKAKEKATVMEHFKNGDIDILVSTSVVEVGVDIPNATVMMIEGAERFGLAQLYQFRGRVGRSAEQSYCFLFSTEEGMGMRRLRAIKEAKNGFELAEKDLQIRGPGDFFGTEQSGFSKNLLKGMMDPELVRAVRKEAVELLTQDPLLKNYTLIRERLQEMKKQVHWE